AAAADPVALAPLVEGAVRVKAAVVAADEHEEAPEGTVGRIMLNYGHTLGRAVGADHAELRPHPRPRPGAAGRLPGAAARGGGGAGDGVRGPGGRGGRPRRARAGRRPRAAGGRPGAARWRGR